MLITRTISDIITMSLADVLEKKSFYISKKFDADDIYVR